MSNPVEQLIEKLSDTMDPDNARAMVNRAIEHAQADLIHALRKVRGHTSYTTPSVELLAGLLRSIERITDAALQGGDPHDL